MRLLVIFMGLVLAFCKASPAEIWVVAPKNYESDSIKSKDLRRLYLGYLFYLDNHRMTLTQIEGEALNEFLHKFIKIDVVTYQQKWYSKIFTGKGELPRQFKNDLELVTFLKTTDHAIGFITKRESLIEGVKIIAVVD